MDTEKEIYYEFITEYISEGKRYGDSIFARNRAEAEKRLRDKRLTERILGYDPEAPISYD